VERQGRLADGPVQAGPIGPIAGKLHAGMSADE
jgi:hypothetical protein